MPDRLRILFVTEDDPLYVIRFFEVFLAELPAERMEICAITIDRPWHEPIWNTLRRLTGLYGVTGVVRLGTRFLLARLGGRSIGRLATGRSIPLLPTASVNAPSYVAAARRLAPDVIVSVAAPEIFRADILGVPRLGCINIHSGRLPVYRGMMPTFWQMLHGEPEVTVTVHEMAERLDAGAVLGTATVPIAPNDSLDRVISTSKQVGARLLLRVLEQVRLGTTTRVALDMAGASYFSFPGAGHVRQFVKRGHRLL